MSNPDPYHHIDPATGQQYEWTGTEWRPVPPIPAPPPPTGKPPPAPRGPHHGLAVAAFVLALVGAILGLIPLLFILAFIGGALGLAFGIIGHRHGLGKAGIVLAVAALGLGVAGAVITNQAVTHIDQAFSSANSAINNLPTDFPTAIDTTQAAMHQVTYRVDGTAAAAMLSYTTANGGQEQHTVPLPFKGKTGLVFDAPEGTFLDITAQNSGETGTVTGHITVDGVEKSTNTSSGPYAIASCDVAI